MRRYLVTGIVLALIVVGLLVPVRSLDAQEPQYEARLSAIGYPTWDYRTTSGK